MTTNTTNSVLLDILDHIAEHVYQLRTPHKFHMVLPWEYETLRQKLTEEIENANLPSV